MAKFVFRVQAALDMRRKQEDEAKLALAQAEARRAQAEAERDQVAAAIEQSLVRARDAEAASGDLTMRVWYRNWIEGQRQELRRRQAVVAQRAAEVQDAVKRAQEAHRKRRILERLRDRAHSAFRLEERRQEQKVFDEIGSLRFTLQRREGTS